MRMKKPRLNREGLPINRLDWTREDWQDLHEALEAAFAKIRERHKNDDPHEPEMGKGK